MLVNVCSAGTQIPSVDDFGHVVSDDCVDQPGRFDLVASRGAAVVDVDAESQRDPWPTREHSLFVRQDNGDGSVMTRWISRPVDELLEEPQGISAVGMGASFEGASRDGRIVYFRTNAPLTIDDPNGGLDPINGTASPISWDLYRYDLPKDLNADPADGKLTRISAGPTARGEGSIVSGSPLVTDVSTTDGTFVVGHIVLGDGIPRGTTVVAVEGETLTLSEPATVTEGGVAIIGTYDPNTNCVLVTGSCDGSENGVDLGCVSALTTPSVCTLSPQVR